MGVQYKLTTGLCERERERVQTASINDGGVMLCQTSTPNGISTGQNYVDDCFYGSFTHSANMVWSAFYEIGSFFLLSETRLELIRLSSLSL